jgi:hypothetical protein
VWKIAAAQKSATSTFYNPNNFSVGAFQATGPVLDFFLIIWTGRRNKPIGKY